jgi:hypothetical protein
MRSQISGGNSSSKQEETGTGFIVCLRHQTDAFTAFPSEGKHVLQKQSIIVAKLLNQSVDPIC